MSTDGKDLQMPLSAREDVDLLPRVEFLVNDVTTGFAM